MPMPMVTSLARVHSTQPLVRWLHDVRLEDAVLVGEKAARLGELRARGCPVPDGFIVTSHALQHSLITAGLQADLRYLLACAQNTSAERRTASLTRMKLLLESLPISAALHGAIAQAYDRMGDHALVIARSSAFLRSKTVVATAGLYDSFPSVCGHDALFQCIRACWASLAGARAVSYYKSYEVQEPELAVLVQPMISGARRGTVATIDRQHRACDWISVRAISTGKRAPGCIDRPEEHLIARETLSLRANHTSYDPHALSLARTPDSWPVSPENQLLSTAEARRLAKLALQIEAACDAPHELEWVARGDELMILQARALTARGPQTVRPSI